MDWSDFLLGGLLGYSMHGGQMERNREILVKQAQGVGLRMIFRALVSAAEKCDSLTEMEDCSMKCICLTLHKVSEEIDFSLLDTNNPDDVEFKNLVIAFQKKMKKMSRDLKQD